MAELTINERFEQVREPAIWSDKFEQVEEPQRLWAGKPITVFDKVLDYVKPVTDWFGLFPAAPKTTPMITEEGAVIDLGKNEEPIHEAMNAVSRGLDTASFGTVNLLKKAVTGEGIPAPETTWGSIMGGASSLVGFLAGGPFSAAKWILGGRLHPTAKGLWYVAQAMAEGGATLGIASALSDILPSIMESESLTDMGLRIGESTAVSSIVGMLFPATGLINSKALRIAVGMAVMDKIRTMGGEITSFGDYYNALVHGTEDKSWIAERTFDYLLDFYFLSKVPSMRKALQAHKGNKFINELDMLNNSEVEQTILALRENREIRRSDESYPNLFLLNFNGKQKTWEEFRAENGLRVALRDNEGNVTVGNKGEIHAQLWARLPEKEYEDGFVLEEAPGRFFTRKEMMDIYRQLEEVAEENTAGFEIMPEPEQVSFTHWRDTGERVSEVLKPKEHMGLLHGEEKKTVTNYGLESKGGLVVDRVYVYTAGQEKEGVIQASNNLYIGRVPRDKILSQEEARAFRARAKEKISEGKEYAPGDKAAIEETAYQLARKKGYIGIDTGQGTIKLWVDIPVKQVKSQFLDAIVKAHDATEGSTFNVMSGENLVGKDFFSVSIYPNREITLLGRKITQAQIREYIARNVDLLSNPDNSVGTWWDPATNQTYLDVVITVPDRAEALELARKYRQKAIYDLKNEMTIELETFEQVPAAFASEKKFATFTNLPSVIHLPELVGLATDIMKGKYPTVVEKIGKGKALGGTIAGLFVPKGEGEIKLQAALFKDINQTLYTLGHELGHLVDYLPEHTLARGNILGRIKSLKKFMQEDALGVIGSAKEIRNELKALTQKLSPFDEAHNPKYTEYRYRGHELYADAITALINNPKLLRDVAPKFYDAFFEHLGSKPEVESLYYEIQDSIRSGTARKESVERLRRSFWEGDRKELALLEQMAEGGESLGTALIDKNWYTLHRLLKTSWGSKVRALLESWDYRVAQHEAYIRDINAAVLQPLKDRGLNYEDFREWLFHMRVVVDRAEIANPGGWNPADSVLRLAEMKNTMPEAVEAFSKAHDAFWQVRKEYFIDVAKRLNIYDEELMKKIEDNEFYATFQVQDYLTARYGATASAKIFQQIGTLKAVTDPFARTLMKDISLMTSMSKIRAVRGVIGAWIELFPTEIRRADTRWNGKFQEIIESTTKGEGLLVDIFEGKAKGWYVPEEIVKSFERNPLEAARITKVLRATVEPFRRVFTEVNYGFFLFNAMRDYYRASRNLPGASLINFFKYWREGLKPAWRSSFGIPDDVAQMALKREMLISVTDTRGMRSEDFQVERILVKYGLMEPKANSKMWRLCDNMITTLTNVGRALERTPKIAGMNFLDERCPNLSEAEKAHIVRSWAGSPDFLRKGTAFGIYNNLLIFSNAMKEGYRADIEAMLSSPGTFWYKTAKYQLMPKLLMKAAALGLFGAGIKEVFDKISEYDLTNYNIIPFGITKGGKAVYLRLPTDECGRLIGGVFWKMLGLNFNLSEGALMDYMAGQAPGWNPGLDVLGDISAYLSGQNPYDDFRGRYAIPDLVWRAHNWRTHVAFAKYLANKLGISLIYRFKTEDDVEIRGWVEKLVNFPILSNMLGRFIKVTDYGEKEHLRRDILQPLDIKRSRQIQEAHTAIARLINGQTLTDNDLTAIAREEGKGSQVISRTVMQDIGRKYGSVYTEALMTAQNVEQKIAILQEIVRKQRERGE